MNKRGWIRIIEAFLAILLVLGILLVILTGSFVGKEDLSSEVHRSQLAVLRDIQVDNYLRDDILAAVIPVDSAWVESPLSVQNRIEQRILKYLECETKICALNAECNSEGLTLPDEKNIYVQSVAIASAVSDSKQLKLFCWRKE